MKLVSRSSMVAVAALLGAVGQAVAADWTVTLLEPTGAGQSKCYGAYGGVQCGYANFGMMGEALLWAGMNDDMRWGPTSTSWCQHMTGWIARQMTNGSMTGSMIWCHPDRMPSTSRAWMGR